MDPEAALQAAKRALKSARKAGRHYESRHYEEAAEYLSNYWDWRRSGGFEPKNGDRRAEAMSEQLSEEWGDGESGWGEAGGYVHEYYEENPAPNPSKSRRPPGAKFLERKYGLTRAEADAFAEHPRQAEIIDRIEYWREQHGLPAPNSPIARGELLEMLQEEPLYWPLGKRANNPDTAAAKRRCMR